MFSLGNKSCFSISHFYQKYAGVKVNHFIKSHSHLEFPVIKLLVANCYKIAYRFDFRFFPGIYWGLPISCQQLKLISDRSNGAPLFLLLFGENPGKGVLISWETDFSH